VDALGNTTVYEAYLSSQFPGIDFTVTTQADSKFKIVSAASIAAKVTRDACLEGWIFEEIGTNPKDALLQNNNNTLGSGYPSGPFSVDTHLAPTDPLPPSIQIPRQKRGLKPH
jgi:ribonuclease H2 subunit A